MRKLFIFVLLVFWSSPASAQDALWSRTYGGIGGECAVSVQQTTDGGYVMVGITTSFGAGSYDVYLIKTDSSGDTPWARTYGGGDDDLGSSVQQTADGGYIVAGATSSFGAGSQDVYLFKTDSTGNTLWARTYGGGDDDLGSSVQQTADGGYIVAGETCSFGVGNGDLYLIKTDSTGDTLWSRTYGGSSWESGGSIQQTTDGGYIVGGTTESEYSGAYLGDVYLIKTNSTGDILWTHAYGGTGDDYGMSVQQTTDGGYIAVGMAESFGAGGFDVYLVKTDSLGNTLWTRTYGGSSTDYGHFVHQTTDGGYIVAGLTLSFGAPENNGYVIKTDSLGDARWSRSYGGSGIEQAYSVQQTTDGGYIVAGFTTSFGAGGYDGMLTKLDSLGNTCFGEFVSSTVMSVSPTITSPATVVTSPPIIVTTPQTTVTSPATVVTTVCVAIRGDANGDGVINSADVVYLINYLFKGGPAPDPLWVGDVNCDGIINSADVVYLINFLFKGGPPPCC